uniref:sugar phosphate nucleotidyltransferase n=1 Tax=Endozoicomonas sp. YOMI1 TaxID=2828739 RepID=UPI0021481770
MGRQASAIILEPVGKNTAPAVALTALKAQSLSEEKDPLLLVLAADHVIQNVQAFHQAIEAALPAARDGKLVTFGIVPTHPETGYGYIKASVSHGEPMNVPDNIGTSAVPGGRTEARSSLEKENSVPPCLRASVANRLVCLLSSLLKSQIWKRPRAILLPVTITGTPACSCLRL